LKAVIIFLSYVSKFNKLKSCSKIKVG
jgi:hypothetical protein